VYNLYIKAYMFKLPLKPSIDTLNVQEECEITTTNTCTETLAVDGNLVGNRCPSFCGTKGVCCKGSIKNWKENPGSNTYSYFTKDPL